VKSVLICHYFERIKAGLRRIGVASQPRPHWDMMFDRVLWVRSLTMLQDLCGSSVHDTGRSVAELDSCLSDVQTCAVGEYQKRLNNVVFIRGIT
jgi:hypothetical protein